MIELNLNNPRCACGHLAGIHKPAEPQYASDGPGRCFHEDCTRGLVEGFSRCPFFLYPDREYDAVTLAVWHRM